MTGEPILFGGILAAAGCCGAIAARAARIPIASGSLAGGVAAWFVVDMTAPDPAAGHPALALLVMLLTASLGFQLGIEADLATLARVGRRALSQACLRAASVGAAVTVAATALGHGAGAAAAIGAAAIAMSPAATIAVVCETRARGELTQRLIVTAAASLALAGTALLAAAAPAAGGPAAIGLGLPLGAACGLLVAMPLSRMATGAAVRACAGGGLVLVAGVAGALSAPPLVLMLMSITAGSTVAAVLPNRDIVRGALRDAGIPCAVLLFAIAAPVAGLGAGSLLAALPAAVVLAGARLAGLLLPGIVSGRGPAGVRESAAMMPMAGWIVAAPLAVSIPPGLPPSVPALLISAGLISEILGMAGARWALISAGEAAAEDAPDAWRASMR